MPDTLLDFLKDELYAVWSKNRQPVERKWIKNENMFKGIAEGAWKIGEGEDWRSKTFIKLAKVKVLTAYSMVVDILLKGGMIPFSMELSPWDRVVIEDLPEDQQSQIKDAIDDQTSLIKQQILDCNGDRELMSCIMSAARYGETYFKTYVHEVTRKGFQQVNTSPHQITNSQQAQQFMRWQRYERRINAPAFAYRPNWNIFRDMETEDMQKNRGVCDREYVSPYDLRKLMGKDDQYYIPGNIERVLRDHQKNTTIAASTDSLPPGRRQVQNRYNTIEKLDFWCRAPRRLVEAFKDDPENDNGSADYNEPENDGDEIEICACVAGDEIIRFTPIPENTRPYGRIVWEINLDDDHGIGVADNIEEPQNSITGMVRAFEDNKKLSANVNIAMKPDKLENWSGKFRPDEPIIVSDEVDRVQDAIEQFIIADVGESLLSGIALMERFSDDTTMLPKILQGNVLQKQKPDTLGEINLLQENASKYLGSVIKNFDEGMIEPIVSRFYEYNMLDTNIQKGKGNFIAKPAGFSAWQDRIVRIARIMQAVQLTMASPGIAQEVRIKKLIEPLFKALEIDPDSVFKSAEEKQADQQAMAQAVKQELDQATMVMLAKAKAELKVGIGKIQAQNQAKLEQIEAQHLNKLEQMGVESDNRIAEEQLKPPSGRSLQ